MPDLLQSGKENLIPRTEEEIMSDDFVSKWISIKPCNSKQADHISMKMNLQKKRCNMCKRCIGKQCDIYTTSEEQASLGKYLIENFNK